MTDLDTELRHYGDVLDEAATQAHVGYRGREHSSPTSTRWTAIGTAAALVGVAIAVLAARGNPEPSRVATPPSTPTTLHDPLQFEPVTLADGLVPWYELNDDAASLLGLSTAHPSSGFESCTEWHARAPGGIVCTALDADVLPAAAEYVGEGIELSIATAHDSRRADDVLVTYTSADPLGTAAPEAIAVAGTFGFLLESDDDVSARRAVAWPASPTATVLIESTGLSRTELIGLADQIQPAQPEVTTVPLRLAALPAQGSPPVVDRFDRLVGAIVNGEVCVLPPDHVLGDTQDTCSALGADSMLLTMNNSPGLPGRYAGLVSGEVTELRIEFADGTALTALPVRQPVGEVQAFIVRYPGPAGTSITALDADGRPLQTIDLHALEMSPSATTAAPTTAA